MRYRFFLIGILLVFSLGFADNPELDKILSGVFHQQDRMDKEIQDAIFDGNFSFIETNGKGDTTKTITAIRKVYSKGYYKQKGEYVEMTVDSKKLSPAELKKENKKSRSNWKTNLPFSSQFRNDYDFYYIGDENWEGFKVWGIGYTPKNRKQGYIEGFAFISQADSNVAQYQFIPVGLPFILKNFNIILDYSKVQGYWVLTKFSMEMEVNVKIIFSLAHKFIRMQEFYTNYKFNSSLEDSFFEKK